ncbi:hypothetical protein HMPREF9094_1208 [Fusobacterium animalis ATCC 51191]|uniref:DUF3592 domain-containing protein n=1 Tax=Fusobacterium animalis ATCC 51191 TaxID=997347 RepID=F9EMQ3_9FUSO|nr:hypothetical protein HMPREF9094_1208 [Fusobacterium animalis ATCC 51191]
MPIWSSSWRVKMLYFIAVFMFLLGFLFISLGRISSDNIKDINELLADNRNIQETKGNLQVIEIRSTRYSFECDCELIFTNQNGKEFSYKETYFSFNSKASFLRKCENKGKVTVTVIYDKSLPSKHFVKELKPLEVNKNSRVGYTIIGVLFILLGLFIVAVNFK